MHPTFRFNRLAILVIAGSLIACSSESTPSPSAKGGSGGSASGGSSGSGGAASGGSSGSGGATGSGGSSGSGGAAGSGGSAGSGGATGSGGSGGSAGTDAGADTTTPPADTMTAADMAPAAAKAVATIMPVTGEGGTITGTVTFTAKAGGEVEVVYALENCPPGIHPTHIHEGSSCASRAAQGMHWGGTRGDGINGNSHITCDAQMKGTLTMPYVRPATPANMAWSVGTGSNTDVVGHVLMVHAVGMNADGRHGCGVITKQ